MDKKTKLLRIIIEDQEEVITWSDLIPKDLLQVVFIYIKDTLRKKYLSDQFSYRDYENQHYELMDIIKYEVTPVFVSIPYNHGVKTFNKIDPRNHKTVYTFKDQNTIRITKFENSKKLEEIEMKISSIEAVNKSNKDLLFEDPLLSDQTQAVEEQMAKITLEVKDPTKTGSIANPFKLSPIKQIKPGDGDDVHEPEEDDDENSSPTFGGSPTFGKQSNNSTSTTTSNTNNSLKVTQGNTGYGKSHNDFVKLNEYNKNPLGQKVELKVYDLEEVNKHKTTEDGWMVINGKVYDVTKYIPYHPGGRKMMPGVGKDGTALFNKHHPWVNAHFILEKYQIGFLKK
jgi:cytochrome-b5 reductase